MRPSPQGGLVPPTRSCVEGRPPQPPCLLSSGPVGFMFFLGPVCLTMNSFIHLTNICQPQTLSHPVWGLTWPLPAWLSHLLAEIGQSLAPDSWVASVSLSRLRSPRAMAATCWAHSGPQFPHQFRAGWKSVPSSDGMGIPLLFTKQETRRPGLGIRDLGLGPNATTECLCD